MNDIISRIREDDELIDLGETRKIMGDVSISSAYEDPELMALRISMTPPGRRTRMVRFIKREIHALRAERVARAEANAENVRAEVEARVEQRRARQRLRYRASATT
jgi:siroheme synthase (precorrin-2 oxidase/ferrochelatase)